MILSVYIEIGFIGRNLIKIYPCDSMDKSDDRNPFRH